jgi:glucosamine-phosphate N-acetyltransferase
MLGKREVRDLQLKDIYERVGLQACLAQLAPVDLASRDIENLYFDRQHSGIRTLVVVVGNTILGTGTLIIEQKFIHHGGKVAHIEDVAVLPCYHGFGIGKIIMYNLIDLAKIANCYKVILNCEPELEPFYKKFGFYRHKHGNMRLDV